MGLDELVIDTLPVNQPYDGLVAEASIVEGHTA